MGVLWDKVWFDLWHHKGRTMLAVLSIAAGVFAIGAIFGLVDQLLSTMDKSHQAVNPSHMNVILRQPIDRETADSLTNIPGIAGVEPLNGSTIRYKMHPDDEWEGASLVMRDDYQNQKFDWLILKDGLWPNNQTIGVERITSDYYGIDIGDEVIFDMPGTDRSFPVTGKIRHPFVPPPDFGGSAYFFVDAEGMARLGIPQGQFFQLLVTVDPYSEAYAKDRAAAIKDQLAKQDVGVAFVIYQDPNEHWARPVLLGITVVLQILAVVSLFTSVIIVINTTTAIITQQIDQIGVIKAIGGTSGTIVRVYMTGVLVFGLLALLIALPLGAVVAFWGTQQMLALFNIDYNTFQAAPRAIVLQIIAAVATPLLAAIWPVRNGARITVREAIASYGLGGNFGTNKFDRFIERFSDTLLSAPYAIALSNVFRRKGRLLLTQGVLVLAGTMFLMVLTLAASMTATLNNELARRQYDIRQFFFFAQRTDRVEMIAQQIPGVEEVEAWFTVTGTILREGERLQDTGGLGAELFGIPSGSEMYKPFIINGCWLQPDDSGNVVVISQDSADFNDLKVGDTISIDLAELGADEWQIIGTYQTITADLFSTDPIYAPADAVVAATKKANRANQIVVKASDKSAAATEQLMSDLSDAFKTRNINVNPFFSRTKPQDREYAFNQFGIVNNMLFGLAIIMGIVGGIGLMGSLSISVVERTREIGVLRSIGAETAVIMTMFVLEGALQGLLSWLISVPLAYVIARPVASALGQTIFNVDLDFAFNYTAVLIWLVAILSISFLASIIPAHSAARVSVRESLAYA
ncbi:MAG: ABC transporter permease [Anaerolineales bacterium]|nr:ABC transporter permease [Anaerolineales bacterium]